MRTSLGNPFFRERAPLLSLKNTVLSCVFDLDATRTGSYSGSGQVWRNLVASPADGAPQSSYDFPLGASLSVSTDDPTFSGSAGNPSAYFLLDGGDFFRIATNTGFFKNIHKTSGGQAGWIALAFRYVDNGTAQTFFATNTNSSTLGLRGAVSSAKQLQFAQRGDTASTTGSHSAIMNGGMDYLAIISWNGTNTRFWLNSVTKVAVSQVFNTTSSDASGPATIAASAAGAVGLPIGTRIYAVSMGNALIDDADAVKILATYNARHGRIYA